MFSRWLKIFPGQRQAGFNLVETLIAVGIAGVAAVGVVRVLDTHNKQVQNAKNQPVMTRYSRQLLDSSVNILMDAESNRGKRVEGVCAWTDTIQKNPGVGKVDLLIPGRSARARGAMSRSRWQEYFEGWDVYAGAHKECSSANGWSKCMTPNAQNSLELSEQQIGFLDLVAAVHIVPVYINPNKGIYKSIPLDPTKPTREHISDVAFEMTATLFYNRETTQGKAVRGKRSFSKFIWAPAVGSCHADVFGQEYRLSVSGTGSSDPSGQTIYNVPDYSGEGNPPLDVDFLKNQTTRGNLDPTGTFITADVETSIAVACNEDFYRCPNRPGLDRQYRELEVFLRLSYNPYNSLAGHASEMVVNPVLDFVRGGTRALDRADADVDYFIDGSDRSNTEFSVSASHSLRVRIRDKDRNDATNTCQQICRPDNNYNNLGSFASANYVPELFYNFTNYNKNFTVRADNPVGCNACNMRNCAQIGLGTFGPMSDQPYQPLDTGIPECWRHDSIDPDPYTKVPFNPDASVSGDGCISARLTGDGDQLELTKTDCSISLPVMCFNFGSFRLAQTLSGNTRELDRRNYNNAASACYEMSYERTEAESLDELISVQVPCGNSMCFQPLPLPRTGTDYEFYNLATQGTFLAPVQDRDIEEFRKWMVQNGVTSSTRFWVNLNVRQDKIIAMPPYLANSNRGDNYALRYLTSGFPTLTDLSFGLGYSTANSSGANTWLLFHHIKYRGAVMANSSQGRSARVLCRRNSDGSLYLANGSYRTVNHSVRRACSNSGGTFLAPTTADQWLEAMLMAKPLGDNLPYPDPNTSSLDPIWVSKWHDAASLAAATPDPPPPPPED